eukprot:5232483-Alexandrium_andersonii.AAC.1
MLRKNAAAHAMMPLPSCNRRGKERHGHRGPTQARASPIPFRAVGAHLDSQRRIPDIGQRLTYTDK